MSIVGADEDGLETLVTALARSADTLEVERRAITAAAAMGADVDESVRTLARLELWCRDRHADLGVRLAVLRWYRTPSGSLTSPPAGGLAGSSTDAVAVVDSIVTLLRVVAELRGTTGALDLLHDLEAAHVPLGAIGGIADVLTLVAPSHDGARGWADRAAAVLGLGVLVAPVSGPVVVAVSAGVAAYWIASFAYDERDMLGDVVEQEWQRLESEGGLVADVVAGDAATFEELLDGVTDAFSAGAGPAADLWDALGDLDPDGIGLSVLDAFIPAVVGAGASDPWGIVARLGASDGGLASDAVRAVGRLVDALG